MHSGPANGTDRLETNSPGANITWDLSMFCILCTLSTPISLLASRLSRPSVRLCVSFLLTKEMHRFFFFPCLHPKLGLWGITRTEASSSISVSFTVDLHCSSSSMEMEGASGRAIMARYHLSSSLSSLSQSCWLHIDLLPSPAAMHARSLARMATAAKKPFFSITHTVSKIVCVKK